MPAAAPSQPYGFPSWPRAISTTNPNDDRGDHHEAGECGCVDVDHPEALGAAVAAQAADRLAAAAEQDQRPERRQDPERDEAGTGIAADPPRREHHEPERDGEEREEPLRLTHLHRTSPRSLRRSSGRARTRAGATGRSAPSRSS